MTSTEKARLELLAAGLTQIDPRDADFESRLRFGLSEVLSERPELREALPLAAMMDDAVRWCA
ncbi:MAG TPA: hypothetical protein VF416_11945 [Marmoricola sp.]